MKIGVDIRPLVLAASGGITQLMKGVCEHMFALYPQHKFFVFSTPFNRCLLEQNFDNVTFFTLPLSAYCQQLGQIAIEESIDVLFFSYPTEFALNFPRQKQIYLIPDIQHEQFPDFFPKETLRARRAAFSQALGEAGAIGTISEFARSTLESFPETRCTDIFLMEPALQDAHTLSKEIKLSDLEKQLIPKKDYLIFPANLWKHKNHENLLSAFKLLIKTTKFDVELVLTGHQDGWVDLSQRFPGLPVNHLGFVRPDFLRLLLEKAKALVFFSLYEGFGMPLLEAFDAGIPVICSNTSSLPEVGGDAILSCDPKDIAAMAALMQRILVDNHLRNDLVEKGKLRLKHYSWDRSAHNLVAACKRVATRSQNTLELPIIEASDTLPLVSIVTPSYNQGRFLKRTIDSVLKQNYPNIEYFVFDGGSTDESVQILESYGDRFVWVSEADKGQTDAINKGMSLAKGDILAYLNSDDVLLPDAIDKVVRYFHQHPDCDLVYGNAYYIDETDQVTGEYNTVDYSLNRLIEDCMICQPASFWRKRVREKIGLFDESLDYAMDYDYWLRLATQGGRICFFPEHLACSRLYPETKTKSSRLQVYQEIFDVCRRNIGYVHKNYYQGYWHHLVYEKETILSRAIRSLPRLYEKTYTLHFKWSGYRHNPEKRTWQFLRRKLLAYLVRFFKLKSFTQPKSNSRGDSSGRVIGYWYDNWLASTVTISPRKPPLGEDFYIGGVAPVAMEMEVYSNEEKIYSSKLRPNRHESICLPYKLSENKSIVIKFSRFVEDSSGRKLAFLLQETNLFSEQDIYS